MEYCAKCFKRICRCGAQKIDIDYYVYPAVYELNRKGYVTTSCCSGHEKEDRLATYISFAEEIDEDLDSEYFHYDSYNYRGFHERRKYIRVKPEIVKTFKKKRTNKLALIQAANRELYRWATTLPSKIPLEDSGVEFTDSYFDEEIKCEEIIDVQKPWLLFAKPAFRNVQTTDDFFCEIDPVGELTEIVVNRLGQMKRFSDNDYVATGEQLRNSGFLKDKVTFDVAGDYRLLLCGYEPYVMVERLLIGGAVWYLSYARTDIAIEYGDHEESFGAAACSETDNMDEFEESYHDKTVINYGYPGGLAPLFDEYDIEDFMDEHLDADELSLFSYLFNKMCRMKINACVFNADNVNIVFSNQTDFGMVMTSEQSVIVFGSANYENLDFSQVCVARKEMLVYANGRLLLRRDVEQ